MSDPVAEGLATLAVEQPPAGESARQEAARRLLDVVSLAVASIDDRPVGIARALARGASEGAHLWGDGPVVDLHDAALANGVGARYRDMNDAYFGREALHPSDMVPALVGLAEHRDAVLFDLYDAVVTAYDVAVDLADLWRTAPRGADHANLILLGTVAGAARLLHLDVARTAAALSIAATSSVATRQTRRGHLTMWKGYAAARAATQALEAVRLARAGVEGPTLAFTGDQAFQAVAVDPETAIRRWRRPVGDRPRILDTHLKVYPLGYLSQAVAEVGCRLHRQLAGANPVGVRVDTYRRATEIMADAEKWHPTSAETADHSLPWIATVAVLDGQLDIRSMQPDRLGDPVARDLLARVEVYADEAMTTRYPAAMPVRVEVTTDDGRRLTDGVEFPAGHARRPLTDDALATRARRMLTDRLGEETAARFTATVLDGDHRQPVRSVLV